MPQLKIKNNGVWVDIPAGGVGVPSGGTTGQVLQKASNTNYATEWATPPSNEWILAGTSSSSSQPVTIPATAKELYIIAQGGTPTGGYGTYSGYFVIQTIPSSTNTKLFLGGYYEGSNDFGYSLVTYNETNRTVTFGEFRYYQTTSGTFYIYYR